MKLHASIFIILLINTCSLYAAEKGKKTKSQQTSALLKIAHAQQQMPPNAPRLQSIAALEKKVSPLMLGVSQENALAKSTSEISLEILSLNEEKKEENT